MRDGTRYVLLALLLLCALPASAAPVQVLRDVAYESDGNIRAVFPPPPLVNRE